MTRKRRRLMLVACGLLALGGAAALVLTAFQDNLVFFYSPTDLVDKGVQPGQKLRLGGLVEDASVKRVPGTATIMFAVTDLSRVQPVSYTGVLPDLFREGQGIVAEGRLRADGVFEAASVLAKHDETYMPPEVAAALKKSGRWQEKEARR